MSQIDFFELAEALARVRSPRVALRPASLADAYPLFRATRNPKFNRHLLWDQPDTQDDVLERVDAIVQASAAGRLAAFSAVVAETGDWVALYRFQPHAEWLDAAEVGIWTHDRFWHGRYSLEIMRLCFSAAFSLTTLRAIIGAADVRNRASCNLMSECGMRRTRRYSARHEMGRAIDAVEYRITAQEWAAFDPLTFTAWDARGSLEGPDLATLEALRPDEPAQTPTPPNVVPLRRPLARLG